MKYNPPYLLHRSVFRLCALVIFFFSITTFLYGQGQAIVYAKALNNSAPRGGAVVNRAVAVDASGNTYVTGSYQYTADLDPGAGVANFTSSGGTQDIFIAKFDASGNYLWAKSIGGTGTDITYGIALDASANIYITGYFA